MLIWSVIACGSIVTLCSLRWNGPLLSKMQCSKLKRAMENQGVNWPLASEVKVLPNGKKQTVRSIVDEASAAASAASPPSLQRHVDSSFFHNVKFKGHLCKTPHSLPPFLLPLLLQQSPQPPRPPTPCPPPPLLTLITHPPPLTTPPGHRNRPARLAAIDKAMADMPRLVAEYRSAAPAPPPSKQYQPRFCFSKAMNRYKRGSSHDRREKRRLARAHTEIDRILGASHAVQCLGHLVDCLGRNQG